MDLLSSRDWRSIAELWAELNEFGLSNAEQAWDHFRLRVRHLLDVDRGFTTVQKQLAQPTEDPLFGFRPILTLSHGPQAERFNRVGEEWASQESNYLTDPVIRHLVEGHGRARTFNQRHCIDKRTFDGSTVRRLYEVIEVEDRIVSTLPIADGLEMTLGFDRARGSRVFRQWEMQMLDAIVRGVLPLAKAYLRSRGLMPGQQVLTPREREVLTFLLGPLSEKEIADRLDLSDGYLHQVVVRIYRKLGARSRAELMSMWL